MSAKHRPIVSPEDSDLQTESLEPDTVDWVSATTLIRSKKLLKRLGISKSTLYRWIAKKIFPKQVRMGGIVGWRPAEVAEAIRRSALSS